MNRCGYLLLVLSALGTGVTCADTFVVTETHINGGSYIVDPAVLVVNHHSNPVLTLTNGAAASWSGASIIGLQTGESGHMEILSGSQVSVYGEDMLLGDYGGVPIYQSMGYIGLNEHSIGSIRVSGTGSSLQHRLSLSIGMFGNGTLTIEDGGTASNAESYIGHRAGSTGNAVVADGYSQWTSGYTYIGHEGTGTLTVRNGGAVTTSNAILGQEATGNGRATVIDRASSWRVLSHIDIGKAGVGHLEIAVGGRFASSSATIGSAALSEGKVIVRDEGSWQGNSYVEVGHYGKGTLEIRSGGTVTSRAGRVGIQSTGSGSVIVSDEGSEWNHLQDLIIGIFGEGDMTIENGGVVRNTEGVLGSNLGGSGEVIVTGRGSMWISSSHLKVGKGGIKNTLTISDEALVKAGSQEGDLIAVSRGENSIRIENGFLALFGEHVDYLTQLIDAGDIELWSADAARLLTSNLSFSVIFYEDSAEGELAAFDATGYETLGGYTVVSVIPEANSFALLGIGSLALVAFTRLRRKETSTRSHLPS